MVDSAFRDMCPFLFVLLLSCSKLLSSSISKLFYINWIWFSSEAFKLWLRSPLDFSKVMSSALGWAKFSEPIVPCGVLSSISPASSDPVGFFLPLAPWTQSCCNNSLCGWQREKDQGSWFNTFRVLSTAGQIPLGLRLNASTREVAGQATSRVCAARTTISGATT